jgi:hypothetical protein
MTQEQKRIKLAEFAGWKGIVATHMIGYAPWRPVTYEERIKKTPVMEFHSIPLDPLPDYFSDLNAVHELVMTLSDEDKCRFSNRLMDLMGDRKFELFLTINAAAAQRAEALGRTLSLWTE